MKVKQEVRDLCLKLRNADTKSDEFKRLEDILKTKWKFTTFNLLALWSNQPTIEYNEHNFSLVMEDEEASK